MSVRRNTALSNANPDNNSAAGSSHNAVNPDWLDQMPRTANMAVNRIRA